MPQNLSNLRRVFLYVWQSGYKWIIASFVIMVILGVLPLLSLYLMKLIVDTIADGLTVYDQGEAFRQIVILISITGAVTLVDAICRIFSELISNERSRLLAIYMHDIIHAKAIEVDLEYYEDSHFYNTLFRTKRESLSRPSSIVNNLIQVGQSGISLLVMAGLLFTLHWVVVVILFVLSIPSVLERLRYSRELYNKHIRWTITEQRAGYHEYMLTGNECAKEVRLFKLGPLFISRFNQLHQKLRREKFQVDIRHSIIQSLIQFLTISSIFACYVYISYMTVEGILTLGDLVMYFLAFQRGNSFLQEIFSKMINIYKDNLFLSTLFEFLDLKPKLVEAKHPKPIPKPITKGIVFNQVSFCYPDSTRNVFDKITLTIRPGETIALVGVNGAGKTTLIKLLCRLYDPQNGSIFIDGIDLRQFRTEELRQEISIIFQDYVQYHLTARENLWFGNIELPSDHNNIIRAARQSGADEVISKLKYGYETILGKWFERDTEELSIGEWQKIALARAFIRNAQIIILDEPSSSMDAKSEYEIFKKFKEMFRGKTTILISHRFSTVRMADTIYVIDNGRIVESGSHEELYPLRGKYTEMFDLQAKAYN